MARGLVVVDDEDGGIVAFANDRRIGDDHRAVVLLSLDVHLHRRAGREIRRPCEPETDRNRRRARIDS